MPVVKSMVFGEMEIAETNWGDQDAMVERVKGNFDDSNSNIRVVVKVRPPNQRELALPGGVVVEVGDDEQTVSVTGKPPFTLDVVFAMKSTQLYVFEKIGVDIVQTAFHGYNASMFAYGQTSSGKSFSMMGVRGTELVGLIPRIANLLFYTVSKTPDKEFFIQGSYLEIYNEKLRDLLGSGDDLKVRENPELGVHVAGLTKVTLNTSEGVEKLIEDGTGNRTVAATKYNSESSRSHAVFELHCQQKYKDKNSGEEMQSKTKIALIDLAGSERSDKLGSVGKALQEGNNINKSLTVLGRCIKALVEKANNPKKKINVPFRESVLTYYLRESLAGNARTTMLAAVSPAGSNEEETMSTLRYAASAKQIKTSAKKNEDPLKAKVRELSAEVEALRAQLAAGPQTKRKTKAEGEDADQLVAALKGGEGQGALHDQVAHLDGAEKEAYLKELEEQMALLGLGGFKKAEESAAAKKTRVKRGSSVADPRDVFPQLSVLNKDDLMSHAMFLNFKDNKLTIGKSEIHGEGAEKNDFEIDGMGIFERHCVIKHTPSANKPPPPPEEGEEGEEEKKAGGAEVDGGSAVVELCSSEALVHVNGEVMHGLGEEGAVALKHLDRVILGPCRVIAVFLERKLTPQERASLTYQSAFREFMAGDDDASRLLMSHARQDLLDRVQELDGVSLKQANTIASELCTNIQFTSQLLLDQEGFGEADITLDKLLEMNEVRLKVCCVAGTRLITTQQDLEEVKAQFVRRQKYQALERKMGASKASFNMGGSFASKRTESGPEGGGGGGEGSEPASPKSASSPRGFGANGGFGDTVEDLAIKVVPEQLLFEVEAEDFGDILAELKATHTSLRALLGGVNSNAAGGGDHQSSAAAAATSSSSSMIRSVFDAVDTDGSGLIDKYELQACIEKFNVEHDPKFFKYVLREEGIKEDDELNFEQFERFLIRFLQHQFYKKIESHVTNKTLFLNLGGRAVSFSHRGSVVENTSRKSMALGSQSFDRLDSSMSDATSKDGKEEDDEEEEEDEEDAEEQERLARQKKLGREAKAARMRQRMKQNAVVTNFITTLKGDLQKAMQELDELTAESSSSSDKSKQASKAKAGSDLGEKKSGGKQGAGKGKDSSAGQGSGKFPVKLSVRRKKKKSEKDVYGMLADKIKKAIKDLEQQHKTTVMVSKERDQLEDYLTRMLAERDAMIPSSANIGNGGQAQEPSGGGGGMSGFAGRPGKAMDL